MRQFSGAWDGDDEVALVHQPCQRNLCRGVAARAPESVQHLHDAQVLADGFGLEAGKRLSVIVGTELRVFVDETAEESSVDGAVRHEADTQFLAQRQYTFFHCAMHQVVFALNGGDGANGMGTTDGVGVHFTQSPMEYFTLLDKPGDGLCHNFDGRVRVAAVLVEHVQFLHAEAAEGVFAHLSYVCRAAVLLGLHLHAVHIFVSELGGDTYFICISFQGLAHQFLVSKRAIALCRIEERHAPLDSFVYQTYS